MTITLDGRLPSQPGQFAMLWLPGIEERPFTIMDDDPLSFTIAMVGPFTQALCKLDKGDRLWVRGPYGRGFPLHGTRHLMIGGGSGAAALTLLTRRALAQGHQVSVVLGARTSDLLMLPWRFAQLGCPPTLATNDGTMGICGTALDAAQSTLDSRWPDAIYACGPEVMLQALARRAEEIALPLWISLERAMKCGMGVCGACHCGDQLVCRDGPVFPGQALMQFSAQN